MRKIMITAALALCAVSARAETIEIGVNGLVCGFCAQGIEKSFDKVDGVEKIDVSLEEKRVLLHTRTGTTLDDATITRVITDAGFNVTGISRTEEECATC